jgi:hypothetical protein
LEQLGPIRGVPQQYLKGSFELRGAGIGTGRLRARAAPYPVEDRGQLEQLAARLQKELIEYALGR